MVPHAFQGTVLVADDHGVLAVLVGVVEGIPFFLGHVLRIELGAGRFFAEAFHKGFVVVEAVPRAVSDAGELTHIRIADA